MMLRIKIFDFISQGQVPKACGGVNPWNDALHQNFQFYSIGTSFRQWPDRSFVPK
jgi:hypothetical protein